jgi:hypothetical protein
VSALLEDEKDPEQWKEVYAITTHLEPLLDIVEGLLVCNVIDHDNTVSSPVVAGGDGPEKKQKKTIYYRKQCPSGRQRAFI